MAWARGAIFFGSDYLREKLIDAGAGNTVSIVLPPLVVSTLVQIANQPLVRATITIQNPESPLGSVRAALAHIYRTRGLSGLWHGVSAGIMKTVPKYITAVAVKDYLEAVLPRPPSDNKQAHLYRSAIKAVVAGVAGAVLTNPLDVIRNE